MRDVLFKHLEGSRQATALGFGHQRMHVFGHDNVGDDVDAVPFPHLLQSLFEDVARLRGCEKRGPTVTTERDEMKIAGLLKAVESAGHDWSLIGQGGIDRDGCHGRTCPPCPQKARTGMGHPKMEHPPAACPAH